MRRLQHELQMLGRLRRVRAQKWDAANWRWEREYERQQKLKAEAAKQAAAEAERARMEQRLAELAAAEQAAAADTANAEPTGAHFFDLLSTMCFGDAG